VISYSAEFKLKFILYADKNGKQAAARQFDVDLRCFCTWYNQKGIILSERRRQYSKWISIAKHLLTSTWTLKQAALSKVYQWILRAWIAYYIRFYLQKLQSDGNFKRMNMTDSSYVKGHAIATVYVIQIGSPEF
jgi:hypothetical protein